MTLSCSSGSTFCKVSCLLSSIADWLDILIDLCFVFYLTYFHFSLRTSFFTSCVFEFVFEVEVDSLHLSHFTLLCKSYTYHIYSTWFIIFLPMLILIVGFHPAESHPTIARMLSIWVKDDVPVLKSPTFEGDQIEEFCAYAENSTWHLLCKAVVLMYLACAGRIGELSSILWEDVRQVEHEGRSVWMFSYLKEKQDGRPEKMESMLGDEISNLVFTLYTGIFDILCMDFGPVFVRVMFVVSLFFCFFLQTVSRLKNVLADFSDTYVGIALEIVYMQLVKLLEFTRLTKFRRLLLGGMTYRSLSYLLCILFVEQLPLKWRRMVQQYWRSCLRGVGSQKRLLVLT